MEDDSDKLIREDRDQHPNCSYSISKSKTCRTKDGSLVCEMMKTINRNCPDKRSVNIYSSTSKFDDNDQHLSESTFPGFHDPFDLFKQMERSLSAPNNGRPAIRPKQEPSHGADQGTKDPNTWIEFKFGNDAFSDGGKEDEGLLGSIFKQFGIRVSSGSDAPPPAGVNNSSNPKRDDSGPKVPPGTKVGPPEDI